MYEHDATEQAFKNGASYMRGQIVDKLIDMKVTALGLERVLLSEIIEKIKKMEVRT